jgi:hypothetical protein
MGKPEEMAATIAAIATPPGRGGVRLERKTPLSWPFCSRSEEYLELLKGVRSRYAT